jgi:hypothetical protein
VAPTTCSSCGGTGPGHQRPARRPPEPPPEGDAASAASAVHLPGVATAALPGPGGR